MSDLLPTATTRPGAEGLVQAADSLRQLIMTNVSTDSWRDNGGTIGNISNFGGKLVINATDMNHLEIDRLLAELRRSR